VRSGDAVQDAHDDHDGEDEQAETLTLRIVAVFASAVLTMCGLSLFFNKWSKHITMEMLLCVRAASAGAMLSVAIVHIMPEAAHNLESVTDYPLAGTLVLLGMFVAYAFEALSGGQPHDHVQVAAPPISENARAPSMMHQPVQHQPAQLAGHSGMAASASQMIMVPGPMRYMPGPMVMGTAFGANKPVDVETDKMTVSRLAVESMEMGCVAHSVVLGLSLGLQTELNSAIILFIVLLLHQTLEAICLSHLIASLENRTEAIIMCVMTTCSMPCGIIIGLIISYSANATSNADTMAPITAGIVCVAGGMLLYSALVNIIAEDMKRPMVVASAGLRRVMCLCLLFGGAAMSALAAGELASGDEH